MKGLGHKMEIAATKNKKEKGKEEIGHYMAKTDELILMIFE